jgi:hypothetical protein
MALAESDKPESPATKKYSHKALEEIMGTIRSFNDI